MSLFAAAFGNNSRTTSTDFSVMFTDIARATATKLYLSVKLITDSAKTRQKRRRKEDAYDWWT